MNDDDERAAPQPGHSNLFNNFAVWSIQKPIPAILLFFLLCAAGLFGFHQMRIENFPDLDPSFITVSIVQPGASPAQMENEIALRVEDSIATIRGLKHIHTAIRDSVITMAVEFRLEKDVNEAQDDVRAAIARVRSDLPDAMQDPIVDRIELSSRPLLFFAVESDTLDDEALSWLVDHELSRTLMKVRGVGSITRVGGVDRQIHVDIDHTRAAALGLTAAEVSRALRNVQLESAGGKAELGIMQQPVRTLGNVRQASELAQIRIPLSDGREIALGDIAIIRDTFARPESLALYDGRPVVGFEVARSKEADEVATGKAVRRAVQELAARHAGLRIHETGDFVTTTHQEYRGGMHLLYEGALLAVLVVWLFLRDFRATIIAATALPLSIIPAFAAMHWLDFTINAVTLLAISQVVGILVDDAIVEIENIVRHQRLGKTPKEAAMEAATEIGLAVTATTFTLIAVFLPTAFMDGVVGRFFHQFGWTAALAVFASLVVARLLTPMMAAYTLRPKMPLPEPRWMHAYLHLVGVCLRHRFLTLLLALAFFAASLALLPLLPTSFMPPNDQSQTQVILELPPGADLAQTRAIAEEARQRIMQVEHVRSTYTTIGSGASGGDPLEQAENDPRRATITVRMAPRNERPPQPVIEENIRAALMQLPGVQIRIGLSIAGEKYKFVLSSDNPELLTHTAQQVDRELLGIAGIGNISSNTSLLRPEIAIYPDFARAAALGVSTAAIADTIRVATSGDYDNALPKLSLPDRQVPIVVRLDAQLRGDLDELARLPVPGAHGPVPLREVARLEYSSGPSVIKRYDRARNVTFEIELDRLSLGQLKKAIDELPTLRNLPADVHHSAIGDAEFMAELVVSFAVAIITGVLCIYTVLALLFNSFVHPFTILTALPLSIGGAFVALYLTGQHLALPALIGLVMLMGIATKNSILLVEYTIVARRDRLLPRTEAVFDACHKRARPIIMTTIAMGAGMMPIALGLGAADPSFRAPMAIAVIGGLLTSTALSLLLVPIFYTLIDDGIHFLQQLLGMESDLPQPATPAPVPAAPEPRRWETPEERWWERPQAPLAPKAPEPPTPPAASVADEFREEPTLPDIVAEPPAPEAPDITETPTPPDVSEAPKQPEASEKPTSPWAPWVEDWQRPWLEEANKEAQDNTRPPPWLRPPSKP